MEVDAPLTPHLPTELTEGWTSIDAIDMHTGGEPLRIILNGFPALTASTVLGFLC
ncbi:hypothetical protein [Microbulbifer elongatus]|uniref:hypothetical protein n=1 Tax=Microbulbifer elongatus TaxID=86173 RepID=UPI001CFE0B7B|nr:hypothetical protein [Microbulbifer elongatus]